MLRRYAIVVVTLASVACSPDRAVSPAVTTATPSPTVTPSPSPTPTPSPSPSPTPEPEALAPQIAEFSQAGGSLHVRIHNRNENLGLARVGYNLTAVAADGSIIGVFGGQGLAGAPFATIYQLPPGGDFGLDIPMDPSAPAVASLELVITDEWIEWDTANAPEVTVSDFSLIVQDFIGPKVTGRVSVPTAPEDGPFNVWVQAFVSSPSGLIVLTGPVDCITTADPRAFEITSFAFNVAGPFTLQNVVAYTTTVPGITDPAPDLC